jgi:hypothetical protein
MTTNRTEQVLAALRGASPPPSAAKQPQNAAGPEKEPAVRFTFDVPRDQHRFIRQFVLDAESTASAATRILWTLVQEDSGLAERLRGQLAALKEGAQRHEP